jgi:hypothetical protein
VAKYFFHGFSSQDDLVASFCVCYKKGSTGSGSRGKVLLPILDDVHALVA